MKAKLLYKMDGGDRGWLPTGTVIDHPDAYKLVRRGCAVAADEECERAANMTPEQLAKAQAAHEKVSAGLLPEDYPAWEAGYMRGYNPDGSWIPGPNADELDEIEWEEYKQESPLYIP